MLKSQTKEGISYTVPVNSISGRALCFVHLHILMPQILLG